MSQPISVQDTAEAEKSCASCRFRCVFPCLFMHEAGPFSVFWGSFSVFVLIEAACFSMYVDELSLASLTLFPGKLTFDGMR